MIVKHFVLKPWNFKYNGSPIAWNIKVWQTFLFDDNINFVFRTVYPMKKKSLMNSNA